MKTFAAVFPGQGSQCVGMARDFMNRPEVASLYDRAAEVLGFDLRKLTVEGPEEELNRTENTQPALLTASVAAYTVFRNAVMRDPAAVAGHSLGEYTALVVAGVIGFEDAVKLVRLRGQCMQEAVPAGVGAMAAVLGLDDAAVVEACNECSAEGSQVWAANFNSPGQVVISGHKAAVEAACRVMLDKGARKAVPLTVSVPSHCPLMNGASEKLRAALAEVHLKDAAVPVYCNSSAQAQTDAGAISEALLRQLTGPVQWTKCVLNMRTAGVQAFVECGSGRVLSGLIRRIDREAASFSVTDMAGVEQCVAGLNA